MRFVLCLALLSAIIACDTTRKTSHEGPASGPAPYSYEISKMERKDPACKQGKCSNVTIAYPVFNEGPELHSMLNERVKHEINSTIQEFTLDGSSSTKTEDLVSQFFGGYQKFREAFPESSTPWHINMDIVVSYTHPKFVSLSITTSSYTGGAHPNNTVEYVNVSSEGKTIADLTYFVSDTEKIRSVAEGLFRKKYHLSPSQDLAEEGFIFDNNEFSLTENFGFSQAGLVFYYNEYEIASHADGPTVLVIPMEFISEYFRFQVTS